MNAPGTAKRTTVPLPSASPLPTGAGPSPVILIKVTSGMRSPTDSVIASPGPGVAISMRPRCCGTKGQNSAIGRSAQHFAAPARIDGPSRCP